MILSQTAEYGISAVTQLARYVGEPPRSADEIGRDISVPRNYLSKVLHELVRAGIAQSIRGRNGGFQVARDPATISLAEVVAVFDPGWDQPRCLLGRAECKAGQGCAAHERWMEVKAGLRAFLQATTIAELARRPSSRSSPGRAREDE